MAVNLADGKIVLFGGHGGGGTLLADTWTWDGSTWTEAAPLPAGRSGAAMAFDPSMGRILLFGGFEAGSVRDQLWAWDGSLGRRRVGAGIARDLAGGPGGSQRGLRSRQRQDGDLRRIERLGTQKRHLDLRSAARREARPRFTRGRASSSYSAAGSLTVA